MTLARGSLRTFLSTAKNSLQNALVTQQHVTLVIGNESADLDSITSAILLAYIRSNTYTNRNHVSVDNKSGLTKPPPICIPVLNIPREDVQIRPELLALLPQANLEPSHLITLDDLSSSPTARFGEDERKDLQPHLTDLLLVDHNKLAGPLAAKGFSDRVIGCIDHHVDEHTVPSDTGDEPRIIETCGSCTSLVTQHCRTAWDMLSSQASDAGRATSGQSDAAVGRDDGAVRRTWDAQIARLAIASVLIDTHLLNDPNKTTDLDRQIVNYLEAKINAAAGMGGTPFDREAYYNKLDEAKRSLDSLSPRDILRKDYKQWEVSGKLLGISSVVKDLPWQIDHADGVDAFRKVMHEYAVERKLDLFSIMAHVSLEDGQSQRELLVWALDGKNDSYVDQFEKDYAEELGLEEWKEKEGLDATGQNSGKMKIWFQREVQFSRKQVAPKLRDTLEKGS